jgi:methyl coenzyme M reductase beta subunit
MLVERRFEARVAALCFTALGTSVLSAWGVGAFAPDHVQTAAGVGLALPFAAMAVASVRRRWSARLHHGEPSRSRA